MGYDKNITSFLYSPLSLDPIDLKTIEDEGHQLTSESSHIFCDNSNDENLKESRSSTLSMKRKKRKKKAVHKKLLIKNILIEDDMSKLTERQRILNQRFKSKMDSLDNISLLNFGFDLFPYDRNNICNLLEIKNNKNVGVEYIKENKSIANKTKRHLTSELDTNSRKMPVTQPIENVDCFLMENKNKCSGKGIFKGQAKKRKITKSTKRKDRFMDQTKETCQNKKIEVQNTCLKTESQFEKSDSKTKKIMRETNVRMDEGEVENTKKEALSKLKAIKIRIKRYDGNKTNFILRLPIRYGNTDDEKEIYNFASKYCTQRIAYKPLLEDKQIVKYIEPLDLQNSFFLYGFLNIFKRDSPFKSLVYNLKEDIKEKSMRNESCSTRVVKNEVVIAPLPIKVEDNVLYYNDELSIDYKVTNFDFYEDSSSFFMSDCLENNDVEIVKTKLVDGNLRINDEFLVKVSIYLDLLCSFFVKHKCELRKKIRLQIEKLNYHIENEKSISDIEDGINLLLCTLVSCTKDCK